MHFLYYLHSKVCESKVDIISLLLPNEGIEFLRKQNIPFKLKECDDLENKILQIVMAKKDLFSNANKQLVMDKLLINLIGW